jgi:hypothetical protein
MFGEPGLSHIAPDHQQAKPALHQVETSDHQRG